MLDSTLTKRKGAAYDYITFYAIGEGVPRDYAEAVKWSRMAAEQGQAGAQVVLGNAYSNGWSIDKDDAKAVEWWRRAANQGDAMAQAKMGGAYFMGAGVPKDFVLAYMWLNLAAAQGFLDTLSIRDSLEQTMTPEQIAEGQRLSREWKPKHSETPAQ